MGLAQDQSESINGIYLAQLFSPAQSGVNELAVDFVPANVRTMKPDDYMTIEHCSYRVIDPGVPTTTNAVGYMYLCSPDMQPGASNIFVANVSSSFNGKVKTNLLGPLISRGTDTMQGTGKDESISFGENNDVFPLVIPPLWFVRFATFSFTGSAPTAGAILNVTLAFRLYRKPITRTVCT